MTVKVLDNGSAGILVLIIPFAFGFVVLYQLWPFLLALAALIVIYRLWQNYQWQKWCGDINPYFNQLIRENQGCVTPVDLSVKANLALKDAKLFLTRKSEEYGSVPKNVKDRGVVFYFPTASALGSIFDDSEPEIEPAVNSYQLAAKESNKISVKGIAQLAKQEQSPEQSPEQSSEKGSSESPSSSPVAQLSEITGRSAFGGNLQTTPTKEDLANATATIEPEVEPEVATSSSSQNKVSSIDTTQSLIQAELAKRLDLNTSTVGRRKSDPDFEEWSQSKDPEGIAWRYQPATRLFEAVVPN